MVNETFAQTDSKAFNDVSFALRNGGGSLMYRFGNADKPCRISLNGNADYQKLIQTDIEKSGVKQEFTSLIII